MTLVSHCPIVKVAPNKFSSLSSMTKNVCGTHFDDLSVNKQA
jgi:hypothetical protein